MKDLRLGESRDKVPHVHIRLQPDNRVWFDIFYTDMTHLDMMLTAALDHFHQLYGKQFIDGLRRWALNKDTDDLSNILKSLNTDVLGKKFP